MNEKRLFDTLNDYELKKKTLIGELKNSKESIALGKSTSNLFRPRNTENSNKINVKNFNKVISIDQKNMIAEVEGMTTYEDLVDATLRYDLLPTVVPELKSITSGGALSGIGIESSSFKYGLVHETIIEIEVLLSNGEIVLCTRSNAHKDLFFSFPNSYGTLGYVLKLKVKLIKAKPFVKLTHTKFNDPKKYFSGIKKLCEKNKEHEEGNISYIDGTIFSNEEMYITTGEFTDSVPSANLISDYTYMQVYYKSIAIKKIDYLKTIDYIWRWDTDWFWCSKEFYAQNNFIRFLAGRKLLRSTTYWKIMSTARKSKLFQKIQEKSKSQKKESVIQDVEIPVDNAEKFIDFFHKTIGIKPVWVCPTMPCDEKSKYTLYPMNPKKLYINFGFWDAVETSHEDGYYNKIIERKVQELSGKKSLYSTSYYAEKDFWKLYNGKKYFSIKNKYDKNLKLKNLYEKCVLRR